MRLRLIWFLLVGAFSILSQILDIEERRPLPRSSPGGPHADPGSEIRAITAEDPLRNAVAARPLWRFGDGGVAKTSVGSAFSVAPGVWITAKHVTHGCDQVLILDQTDKSGHQPATRIVEHEYADAALIETRRSGVPVPIGESAAVFSRSEAGYHFGFPSSDPGQARSLLIGDSSAQTGPRGRRFPIWVWSEQARYPNAPELGGISGGPVFDDTGAAVGITIGGNPRRGRIATTDPMVTTQLLNAAQRMSDVRTASLTAAPVLGVSAENYIDVGDRLRAEERVAQVYCHVR